jgi:hypothetical protein
VPDFSGILHFVQNDNLACTEVPQGVELARENGGVGANARSAMKQFPGGARRGKGKIGASAKASRLRVVSLGNRPEEWSLKGEDCEISGA